MSGLKIAGGIIALAGGALVLIAVIMGYLGLNIYASVFTAQPINGIINLILAILALVGGILGLAGKRAGGVLALIAGIVFMLMGILLLVFVTNPMLALLMNPCTLFFPFALGPITFEAIMALVGGILILAGGKS